MNFKKNIFIPILFCLVSLMFVNCSIQKRIYRNGYHISWNHKKTNEQKKPNDLRTERALIINDELLQELIVSSDKVNESELVSFKKNPLLVLGSDTCGDKLLLQNADELLVKILEIDEHTIKYKRCDNVSGPTYSINKNKVALITYANGVKEVVQQEPPEKINPQRNVNQPEVPRKINPLGLTSLLLYIFGVILARTLNFTLISPSLAILLVLLSILPLIFAYISLFQFKREPTFYKGKWMPITVVCIYLAGVLLVALALAGLSAFSGGGLGTIIAILLLLFVLMLIILIAALIPKYAPVNAK